MRTSTTFLELIGRLGAHPGWAYCNVWHYPPMVAHPRRHRAAADPRSRERVAPDA